MSVQLSKCGWAWLVCGRRLLIWQYKQNGPSKWQSVSQCRELTLPPSDLAHRAELVIVYTSKKASTPSCIAVSPEGAVRYWPSIAHEGSWIEESTDLQVTAGFLCGTELFQCQLSNFLCWRSGNFPVFSPYSHIILFSQLQKQSLKHGLIMLCGRKGHSTLII